MYICCIVNASLLNLPDSILNLPDSMILDKFLKSARFNNRFEHWKWKTRNIWPILEFSIDLLFQYDSVLRIADSNMAKFSLKKQDDFRILPDSMIMWKSVLLNLQDFKFAKSLILADFLIENTSTVFKICKFIESAGFNIEKARQIRIYGRCLLFQWFIERTRQIRNYRPCLRFQCFGLVLFG